MSPTPKTNDRLQFPNRVCAKEKVQKVQLFVYLFFPCFRFFDSSRWPDPNRFSLLKSPFTNASKTLGQNWVGKFYGAFADEFLLGSCFITVLCHPMGQMCSCQFQEMTYEFFVRPLQISNVASDATNVQVEVEMFGRMEKACGGQLEVCQLGRWECTIFLIFC